MFYRFGRCPETRTRNLVCTGREITLVSMVALINLQCGHCGKSFSRKASSHKYTLNRNPKASIFCTQKCKKAGARTTLTVPCGSCGLPVERVPSALSQNGNRAFCSRSCSASVTNREFPRRRKRIRICADCSTPCTGTRCLPCLRAVQAARTAARTKGELFLTQKSWQGARSTIQEHARKIYFQAHPNPSCQVCGYTKHVEVCHVRNVADWPDEATFGEINDSENLAGLCPTHHWEFDNDALDTPL